MSDNYIQHNEGVGGTGSDVATFGLAVTAHSTIVAWVWAGGNPAVLTCSSSNGGAMTAQAAQQTDATNGPSARQFVLQDANAGTHTITGTDSNGNNVFIVIVEIGSTGASAVSGSASAFQASPGAGTDAITTGTVTVTGNATLVSMACDTGAVSGTAEPVAGTSFTSRLSGNNGILGSYRMETRAVAANAAGTFTAGSTGGSDPGMSFAVAILNTAGGGGPTTQNDGTINQSTYRPRGLQRPKVFPWPIVQAPVTDTQSVNPAYRVWRTGPQVLRRPPPYLVWENKAPVTDTNFVFPTYQRGISWVGPQTLRRPHTQLLDVPASTTQSFSYSATGGLQFGGAAVVLRVRAVVASGGLLFGGVAGVIKSIVYSASGGIVFGGAASAVTKIRAVVASGGIVFSGIATQLRNAVRTATGGIVFGGAGTVSTHVSTATWVASGGITFGGSAGYSTFTAGGSPAVTILLSQAGIAIDIGIHR